MTDPQINVYLKQNEILFFNDTLVGFKWKKFTENLDSFIFETAKQLEDFFSQLISLISFLHCECSISCNSINENSIYFDPLHSSFHLLDFGKMKSVGSETKFLVEDLNDFRFKFFFFSFFFILNFLISLILETFLFVWLRNQSLAENFSKTLKR